MDIDNVNLEVDQADYIVVSNTPLVEKIYINSFMIYHVAIYSRYIHILIISFRSFKLIMTHRILRDTFISKLDLEHPTSRLLVSLMVKII